MVNKYHYLLVKESMRTASSSEEVMLARVWDSDERQLLASEKEAVKNGQPLEDLQLSEEERTTYKDLISREQAEEEERKQAEQAAAAEVTDLDLNNLQRPDQQGTGGGRGT